MSYPNKLYMVCIVGAGIWSNKISNSKTKSQDSIIEAQIISTIAYCK